MHYCRAVHPTLTHQLKPHAPPFLTHTPGQTLCASLPRKPTHHTHLRYLELQIHGEIQFERDVDMLVVDEKEVTHETEKWLRVFSKKFGCLVCMFSKGTMKPF